MEEDPVNHLALEEMRLHKALPQTGLRKGRHPRLGTVHKESCVSPVRLDAHRSEKPIQQTSPDEEEELEGPAADNEEEQGHPASLSEEEQEHPESLSEEEPERPAPPKRSEPLPVPPASPGPSKGDECTLDLPTLTGDDKGSPMNPLPSRGDNTSPAGQACPVIPRGEVPMPVPDRGPQREADMMEPIVASGYGIPKPKLPYFSSGREKAT